MTGIRKSKMGWRSALLLAGGCVALVLGFAGEAKAASVLWVNNFESGAGSFSLNSTLTAMAVANPEPEALNMSSTVLQINDSGTLTSPWGELRVATGTAGAFQLSSYGAVPGVDTVSFTMNYYIPSNTVSANGDTLSLILRFSAVPDGSVYSTLNSAGINLTNVAKDTWATLTINATIPVDSDPGAGTALSLYMVPIVALSDGPTGTPASGNPAGLLAYYDNISFSITPEPGRALLLLGGMLGMVMRRRRGA